ncbi:MAG: hypothetical protein V2B14_00625 [bacterium]
MATPKEELNKIINQLNEKQISEVINFAEFIKNKFEKDFWENIPLDDEPLTDEDLQAIKEGEEELKTGKTLTYDEVFGNND